MSEMRLKKYVVDNLEQNKAHVCFVESRNSCAGIPDIDFCINGVEGKLELKYGTDKKPPALRPTQCAWFRRRAGVGGNCWVLLAWNKDSQMQFFLLHGSVVSPKIHASNYASWTKEYTECWYGKINWEELISIIAPSHDSKERSR